MNRFTVLLLTVTLLACMPSCGHAEPKESVFFTYDDLVAIARANKGFIAKGDDADQQKDAQNVDRGRRIITLSGIVYHGAKDWTIWLNGERVTPKNIPAHVKALSVRPEYVVLKWEDTATNRIVSLTLRPHQRYSLDLDIITPSS